MIWVSGVLGVAVGFLFCLFLCRISKFQCFGPQQPNPSLFWGDKVIRTLSELSDYFVDGPDVTVSLGKVLVASSTYFL